MPPLSSLRGRSCCLALIVALRNRISPTAVIFYHAIFWRSAKRGCIDTATIDSTSKQIFKTINCSVVYNPSLGALMHPP
jgi:hypothetical protein